MAVLPLAVRAAAKLELRRRAGARKEQATDSYGDWLVYGMPEFEWDAPHFREMQGTLDDVTLGSMRRVFYSVAIRHGKTLHNSIGYAAYRLERDPSTRVLVCSYNSRQAEKISRDIRKLFRLRGGKVSRDRDTAGEWETLSGGGVRAVGAGSGVASVNADVIIIDDPIGSREDAESLAKRNRVWDWISNDLLARTEPHTSVLFTMSRWHTDDPAGRLLDQQAGRWHVVDLPGRAEEDDPLGREVGEALWPEFRDEDWLDEKQAELGSYGFASLIQGRPRPREGGMFHWDWWQLLEDVPRKGRMVRYWDLAGTDKRSRSHSPDFTAGSLLCRMEDERTAIVDVTRFQKSVAKRDAELVRIAQEDMADYPGRVTWWIEREAGINGLTRTEAIVRRLQAHGMTVKTEHPTGSKTARAEPMASAAEAGNIVLCPGDWRDDFRGEAADFPNGLHDDQVDATAGALSKLSVKNRYSTTTLRI